MSVFTGTTTHSLPEAVMAMSTFGTGENTTADKMVGQAALF